MYGHRRLGEPLTGGRGPSHDEGQAHEINHSSYQAFWAREVSRHAGRNGSGGMIIQPIPERQRDMLHGLRVGALCHL